VGEFDKNRNPEMGLAFEESTRWVEEKGLQANGVVYEFYFRKFL
jgi:hypothetical protein